MNPEKVFIRAKNKDGKWDSMSISEIDNETLYKWAASRLGWGNSESVYKQFLKQLGFDVENRQKFLEQLSKYFMIHELK